MIQPGGVDQVSGHFPISEKAIPDRTAADSTRLANNKSPEKNHTAWVAVDRVAISLAGWFIVFSGGEWLAKQGTNQDSLTEPSGCETVVLPMSQVIAIGMIKILPSPIWPSRPVRAAERIVSITRSN